MTWTVYILRCADNTYYIGCTNDLVKRLATHNAGTGAKYTRSRTPVTVVYSESADSRSTAQAREYALKQLSRAEKEKMIAAAMHASLEETL